MNAKTTIVLLLLCTTIPTALAATATTGAGGVCRGTLGVDVDVTKLVQDHDVDPDVTGPQCYIAASSSWD
jgi:hypothetical protein